MSFSQSSFPPWTPMSPTPGAGGGSWSDYMFDNTDVPLSPIMDEVANNTDFHHDNGFNEHRDDSVHITRQSSAESGGTDTANRAENVPAPSSQMEAPAVVTFDEEAHVSAADPIQEDDSDAYTPTAARASSVGGKSASVASKSPRHVSHSTRSKTPRRGKTVRSYVAPQQEDEMPSPSAQLSKKRRRGHSVLNITEESGSLDAAHTADGPSAAEAQSHADAVHGATSKRPASLHAMDAHAQDTTVEHHVSSSGADNELHPVVPQTPSPFTVLTLSDEECLVTAPAAQSSPNAPSSSQHRARTTSQRIAFAPSRSFVASLDDMLRTNERLMQLDDSHGGIGDLFDQFRSMSGILHGRGHHAEKDSSTTSHTMKQSALSTRDRCLFPTPDGFFEAQPLQQCVFDAIRTLGLMPNRDQSPVLKPGRGTKASEASSVFVSLLDWIAFCATVPDATALLKHARQPFHALAVKTFRKRSSILMHASRYLVFVLDDWLRSSPLSDEHVHDVSVSSSGAAHQFGRVSSASRFFDEQRPDGASSPLPPLIWRDEHSSIRINCHRDAMLKHMHPSSSATMSDVFYVASASLPALGLFMSASDFWVLVASFNTWSKTSMQFHTRFVHVVDLRPDFASAELLRTDNTQLRPSSFLSYFDHLLHLASHKQYAPVLTDPSKLLDGTSGDAAPSTDGAFDFNASSLVFAGSPFTPGMGTLLPCSIHNEIWRPYSLQWMPHHTANAFIVQANILLI